MRRKKISNESSFASVVLFSKRGNVEGEIECEAPRQEFSKFDKNEFT